MWERKLLARYADNCVSIEISQQIMIRWLFWQDVAVRLSFTNFFRDWPSVDPEFPTAPYDQKDLESSVIRNFCGDVDNKNGWTYQKAKFVDKQFFSQYNRFSCFLLQVPQTFSRLRPLNNVVLFTTITCRFNIRPYFLQNISSTVVRDVIS